MQMVSGLAELAREFELRDTEKPYVELIDGIEVPKSPTLTRHSILQGVIFSMLDAWAAPFGIVGTECRVYPVPKGERPSSLVPDVAFIAFERMAELSEFEGERPPFAPDVAVEIRSPDDRERNVARKVQIYLGYGGRLVLDVQPKRRKIVAHSRSGVRIFAEGETFKHDELSGFAFDVSAFFARGDIRRKP